MARTNRASGDQVRARGALIVALAVAIVACNELAVEAPASLDLVVDASQNWPSDVGMTDTATVTLYLRNGAGEAVRGPKLTWTAGDPSVLEILASTDTTATEYRALITGRSAGSTQIVARLESPGYAAVEYSHALTVHPLAIDSAGAWPDTLDAAELSVITAQLTGPDGLPVATGGVTWSSSVPSVVAVAAAGGSVDSTGAARALLVGQANGRATITATVPAQGGGATFSRDVVIRRRLLPDSIAVGERAALALSYSGAALSSAQVDWTATDPAVIRVDSDSAVVLGRARGRTDLAARLTNVRSVQGDSWGPLDISIPLRIVASRVQLRPSAAPQWDVRLLSNAPDTVRVRALGAQGDTIDVPTSWSSADPSLLDVAEIAEGVATLTAGGVGTTEVVVRVGGGELEVQEFRVLARSEPRWRTVSVAPRHICALAWDGTPYCWGWNESGALGSGGNTGSVTPVLVAGGLKFSIIRAGGTFGGSFLASDHTCAVQFRKLWCWGDNDRGQIGDVTCYPFVRCVYPVPRMPSKPPADGVEVGGRATCPLYPAYDVDFSCWGEVSLGVRAATTAYVYHADVGGLYSTHLCVGWSMPGGNGLFGAITCAGDNGEGQLGDGTFTSRGRAAYGEAAVMLDKLTPWMNVVLTETGDTLATPAMNGMPYSEGRLIAAGALHSCASAPTTASTTSRLWCWGSNSHFQLGRVGISRSPRAAEVPFTGGVKMLTAGYYHTCLLDLSGAAYCWGSNLVGALGDAGSFGSNAATPVRAAPGHTFVHLSAGGYRTCGVDATGDMYCWGAEVTSGLPDPGDPTPKRILVNP